MNTQALTRIRFSSSDCNSLASVSDRVRLIDCSARLRNMGCGGSKAASAETPTERPQERGQQTTSVVPASAQSTAQAGESDAAVASTDVAAATQSPAAASGSNSTAKILVLYYSTYGHIQKVSTCC